MKLRWKITLGFLAVFALALLLARRHENQLATRVESTRQSLRQQGFKVEWADFAWNLSAADAARFSTLTNAGRITCDGNWRHEVEFMQMISSNSAQAVWQKPELETEYSTNLWPGISADLHRHRREFDAARAIAFAGPVRSQPEFRAASNPLLQHLADFQNLAQVFSLRMALELRDGNYPGAWTNLVAATRLATAWHPEPTASSLFVRYKLATAAQAATWEALQCPQWTDTQLLTLQHEWAGTDFLSDLPETAAFRRTDLTAYCQAVRQEPLEMWAAIGSWWQDARKTPNPFSVTRDYAAAHARELRYRHNGSYHEEIALLNHFRDREIELRAIITNTTWAAMRELPGGTNQHHYQGGQPSRLQAMANLQMLKTAWQEPGGTISRAAARAETQRRLIITAIALERLRLRHGDYPEQLDALAPSLLAAVPLDFMDGKPLRYRRLTPLRFLLYSVGVNCEDNGGGVILPPNYPGESRWFSHNRQGGDLIWPLPATALEISQYQREVRRAREAGPQWGPAMVGPDGFPAPPVLESNPDETPPP